MENNFYTIDKVAKILDLHHKTIRKFIKEGKINASKMGKQWRISSRDLNLFLQTNNVNTNAIENSIDFYSTGEYNKRINVSAVVDVDDINVDEYNRISGTLVALMNSKDMSIGKSTIDIKHDKESCKLRVLLWGGIEFIEYTLDYIKTLIETKNNRK